MSHDYTQGGDALKRRQIGGENSDPSNKLYITAGDIVERVILLHHLVILLHHLILQLMLLIFLHVIRVNTVLEVGYLYLVVMHLLK